MKYFLPLFITVVETCVYHFNSETEEKFRHYTHEGSHPPKKAKTVVSVAKAMASVFWDSHAIILVDYLEKGKQ